MMGLDGGRRLFESEVLKPKNFGGTLGRFAVYFRKYWLALVLVVFLTVGTVWTQVVTPKLVAQAVDCYLSPFAVAGSCTHTDKLQSEMSNEEKVAGIGEIALLTLALYIGGSILNGAAFYVMRYAGQHVLTQIRADLFTQIHRLSLGFYARNEAGNIMSRVTNDTDTINQAFSFALMAVFSGVMLIVWTMVNMLQTNVPYALLSLTIVPVMLIATGYFSGQARKAFRKSRQEMGSVNADLQESIAGAREVQAFNREAESIEQFRQTNAANRDANIRASVFTSALAPTLEALGYVSIGIVVVVGGLSVLRNEPLLGTSIISLGTVFAFLQYVQNFNRPIQQISVLWTNVQSAFAGGERIFSLLDEQPEVEDKPDAGLMPQINGLVEFKGVKAEYVIGEPVLRGIDFTAQPGQTIAIVGPTGAGKTTMINLIPRFYDVTGGAVLIDGVDVRDVTAESLRDQIGIVLQDSFLFSDTVLENIRYGRLDATDEDVIAAAKLVQADTFIERLPEGYHTVLGERGSGLSQGQRQLISIARAALKNPRILILDEATSSVDTRTERLIQAALEKLLAGRTSFVIAHRLSTIRNADVVLMVKAGEIIERGTHNDLLAQRGAYYELYMSQFRVEEEAVS